MDYTEYAVYADKNYIGRFDNRERMEMVIADIVNKSWENGINLDPWYFKIEERIGKVFNYE